MNNTASQRLFFALWPDADTRSRLAALIDDRLASTGGRRVPEENLHITLAFLGDVDTQRQRCVERVAAALNGSRFTLSFNRLGHWRRPKVLWAGACQCPAALQVLNESLQQGLRECGFQPDERPFAPHLTLMRKVRKRPNLPTIDAVEWTVTGFCLVVSRFVPGGVEYDVIKSWPLS